MGVVLGAGTLLAEWSSAGQSLAGEVPSVRESIARQSATAAVDGRLLLRPRSLARARGSNGRRSQILRLCARF